MGGGRYKESLLQWVWQNLQFNCSKLTLRGGEHLHIIDPGELNHGAGPDFLNAKVQVGKVTLIGSIEVHMSEAEWFDHGHHTDKNFNSVVLHVVLEGGGRRAKLESGHSPQTLLLKEYIDQPLNKLLKVRQTDMLPCAGSFGFIHQKAFELQVEKAHREYFEYKVQELLQCYPSSLPPSDAWKRVLIQKIYGALGIPQNRTQMEELFQKASLQKLPERQSLFEEGMLDLAFSGEGKRNLDWVVSGMRPASRPEVRVRQASQFHYLFAKTSTRVFLKRGTAAWDELLSGIDSVKLPGRERLNILKTTVFIPSIYLLGDLFHSDRLRGDAYTRWAEASVSVPGEVVKPFKRSGIDITERVKCAGLAHQYKRYCKVKNCHYCEVFKSAINP